ncbi:MAG: hypothetical protein KDC79_05050 [Cyclobacteriaceae bacterium]|nr:hypothetical protein [Cyclobacteriaceae bacterium]
MKTTKWNFAWAISFGLLVVIQACNQDTVNTSSLYVPTNDDVTSTATLDELQQGRDLYINYCGDCHKLYTPESYSVAQWQNIVPDMARKTNLTSAETELVLKYVTKGNS